jgi:hypothetical protein
VVVNAGGGEADGSCRIALVGGDVRVIGNYANGRISPSAYSPIAVSSGSNVEAGTYDVRLQCYTNAPQVQFHRGNLTVAIAPR